MTPERRAELRAKTERPIDPDRIGLIQVSADDLLALLDASEGSDAECEAMAAKLEECAGNNVDNTGDWMDPPLARAALAAASLLRTRTRGATLKLGVYTATAEETFPDEDSPLLPTSPSGKEEG